MPFKKHGRTYDLVLLGATGYTGFYAAEYITVNLPTDLKWAVAGRSADKLAKVVADIRLLNPDRAQPAVEVVDVGSEADLAPLARKTFVLITTVGPFGAHGEPVFKACAEAGTHYLDVTGEVPFVARMIRKYEAAARASGALMFPQNGIESAPADLVVREVVRINHTQLHAPTRDVVAAVRLKAVPSGGTLNTVLAAFENFTLAEMKASMQPYALSPVPRPGGRRGTTSWLSALTGSAYVKTLGRLTTSVSGSTNASQVERTWGLRSLLASSGGGGRAARADLFAYGPNFSFAEYLSVRTWAQGVKMHLALAIGTVLLVALPPVRWLAKRFVTAAGQGPTRESTLKDRVEYRAVGTPDGAGAAPRQKAYASAIFHGSMYALTGILVAEGARSILEDDLQLEGGVYTPSFLGDNYIERLDKAGFKFESRVIDV